MSRFHPAIVQFLRLLLLVLLSLETAHATSPGPADVALQDGRIDQAITLLRDELAGDPANALSHNLLCRAFYAEEQPERAVPECEAAVAHDPANSDFALWLGRAYGLKAVHGGALAGFTMARRARSMFERAVQLDPDNAQAISDLGEFYVDAPAIVGGGPDKAELLAARLQPRSPMRSHRLLAQIAEKRSENTTAESEFRAAVAAERTPESLVNLGLFYLRRKRYDEAVATLKSAAELDRDDDANLVDAACGLDDMKREPQLAIQLFRRYLASARRSETAPAVRVHVLLGRALVHAGDAAAARQEFQAALALAASYAPALTELNKLPPT